MKNPLLRATYITEAGTARPPVKGTKLEGMALKEI